MSTNQAAAIRLRITGHQAVVGGLLMTQQAVGKLQKATASYGNVAEHVGRRGFWMNQILFTMRRYAYAATLGMTGLATASVVMGFKFNASMESSTVAFEQFLGSEQAARKELDYLYELAKTTPFEFENVTNATRRFLAFGFTLKDTNAYLQTIGDSVAAFGGGGEQIERMVTVFGQIRASGRLLGQDLLQLQQQGIPTTEILLKQLNKMGYAITRADLARVGELGMPAEIGIPALIKGMNELFGGMSAKQAKTFTGQMSTLHDNISQVMGALTLSQFKKATKGLLPGLNDMFGEMSDLIKKQKGQISIGQIFGIAEKHYPQLAPFIAILNQMAKNAKAFGGVLTSTVLPVLFIFFRVMAFFLVPAMRLVAWGMRTFTKFSKILIPVLTYVIGLLILDFIMMRKNAIMTTILSRVKKLLGVAFRMLGRTIIIVEWLFKLLTITYWRNTAAAIKNAWATRMNNMAYVRLAAGLLYVKAGFMWVVYYTGIATVWLYKHTLAVIVNSRAVKASVAIAKAWYAILRLEMILFALLTKRIWWNTKALIANKIAAIRAAIATSFLGAAIKRMAATAAVAWIVALGPIAWIIAGIVALIGILVVLYFKWKWFHDFVNKSIGWIKDNWKLLGIALLAPFAPLIIGIVLAIKYFKTLIGWVKRLVGWIAKIKLPGWGLMKRAAGGLWGGIKSVGGAVGGLATGGGMDSTFPTAPAVAGGGAMDVFGESSPVSNSVMRQARMGVDPMNLTVNSTLNVDGVKMAENNAKHRQSKQARR